MHGRDLLGIAQTGTGKTAAFALPILHRLVADRARRRAAARACSCSRPTRELASQIAESFRDLTAGLSLKHRRRLRRRAARRADPGAGRAASTCWSRRRAACSTISTRASRNSSDVEFLVLDEVDQMLDLGFIEPIRQHRRAICRSKRQNLFFSATMPTDIRKLAGELLHDPVEVAVTPVGNDRRPRRADRSSSSTAPRKRDMLVELFDDRDI